MTMVEKEAEEIMMQKVIKENDCIMTPCKTLEDCQLYDFYLQAERVLSIG